MTISSTNRKAGPFIGNDSTTACPFAFKVFNATDLLVVQLNTDTGVETTLIRNTDYTVTLNSNQNSNPGGTVTLSSAIATGFTVTITTDVAELQPTDLTNQGGFFPQVVTTALDRLTVLIQQLSEKLGRSLKLPISASAGVNPELPFPASNNLLAWNNAANGLQNVDPTTLATIVAFGTAVPDLFTGDGATTQFALTRNPGALGNLDVAIGGVTQRPGLDYAWASGTTITFTSAPPVPADGSANILVRYIQALPQGAAVASSTSASDGASGALYGTVQEYIDYTRAGVRDTIAALRANQNTAQTVAITRGYYAAGDGGGSIYYKDSADTSSSDNGGGVIVDAIGSRWKLYASGAGINVRQFGAKCDSSVIGGGTDDTQAIQRAVTFANGRFEVLVPGFSLVSSVISCPTDTVLAGASADRSGLVRTPAHSGHTLTIGQDVPGLHAGAFSIKNLWLRRHITFNGGAAYVAGTSTTVDNRLTGAQSHIYVQQGQKGVIEDCTLDNMPYLVTFVGGATTALVRNHMSGSVHDHAIAGLQEGLAAVWYKAASDGTVPTEMVSLNNDIVGGFGSAARSVSLGTATPVISENVGQKWAVRVDAMEGYVSHGDYIGGQNEYTFLFNPSSSRICTNIKINGAFFDGARQSVFRFDQSDSGGTTNLVNISDCIFNGELVSKWGITSGSAFSAVTAYDVTISDCKFMGFQLAGIASFSIYGLHISDCTISGYHCYGGYLGDPSGSAAVYVAGSAYSDKITFAGLRMGGAVNNLSGSNSCQWGIYCGGTFTQPPAAGGSVSMGFGLSGGALEVGTRNNPAAPTLVNSWANYGSGFKPAGYYKDSGGVVHLEGLISGGAIGATAFTLPSGFRPTATMNNATCSNSAIGVCVIDASGAVIPNVGSSVWFSLDGISFKAAD